MDVLDVGADETHGLPILYKWESEVVEPRGRNEPSTKIGGSRVHRFVVLVSNQSSVCSLTTKDEIVDKT